MRNGLKLIRFVKNPTMLDDAPWEWGSTGGWCNDMPEFFQGMPSGVYDNIYEDLDDSPVTWHITEPVDPTEYQNEWLGDVVSFPFPCSSLQTYKGKKLERKERERGAGWRSKSSRTRGSRSLRT